MKDDIWLCVVGDRRDVRDNQSPAIFSGADSAADHRRLAAHRMAEQNRAIRQASASIVSRRSAPSEGVVHRLIDHGLSP